MWHELVCEGGSSHPDQQGRGRSLVSGDRKGACIRNPWVPDKWLYFCRPPPTCIFNVSLLSWRHKYNGDWAYPITGSLTSVTVVLPRRWPWMGSGRCKSVVPNLYLLVHAPFWASLKSWRSLPYSPVTYCILIIQKFNSSSCRGSLKGQTNIHCQ